jgi:hypothetical protein
MSRTENEPQVPTIWDGDKRITGTEDFENDFDPTAYPYREPDRPQYDESYKLLDDGRSFSAYAITLQPGVPTKILGEDPSRDLIYFNTVAPGTVVIGEQSTVAAGLGYFVSGAEKLSTTREVWAAPLGAQAIVVSYWVERRA